MAALCDVGGDRERHEERVMGDRWSYPRQASAATYVWQPLTVEGDKLSMPAYRDAWRIGTLSSVVAPGPAW